MSDEGVLIFVLWFFVFLFWWVITSESDRRIAQGINPDKKKWWWFMK